MKTDEELESNQSSTRRIQQNVDLQKNCPLVPIVIRWHLMRKKFGTTRIAVANRNRVELPLQVKSYT